MTEPSKRHILVVEDDEMIRSFVSLHLESNGFKVSGVETGRALFEILGRESIDLIVLDLNLPDGDGLDFAHEIREQYKTPIIIASARKGINDRLTALDLGAIDYVTKPFDPQELLLRIRNLLQMADAKSPILTGKETSASGQTNYIAMAVGVVILIALAGGAGWYFGISKSGAPVVPAQSKSAENQTSPKPQRQPPAAIVKPPPPENKPAPMQSPETTPDKTAAAGQCEPIPDVKWWANKSHASVVAYVKRKFKGDWQPYIKNWKSRLAKLEDIQKRKSSAIASGGIVLKGPELKSYIDKVSKRVDVIQCLAKANSS